MKKEHVKSKRNKVRTIILRLMLLIITLLAVIILTSFICYIIVHTSGKEEDIFINQIDSLPQQDIAIVPGTAVYQNSPTLKCRERLDMAITLFEKGLVSQILVSGTTDETDIMSRYLMLKGISATYIQRDANGFSTRETIFRAKEQFGDKTVYFCTQQLYSNRAKFLMKKAELSGRTLCVDTVFYTHAGRNSLREYLANTKAVFDCLIYHGRPRQSTHTAVFSEVPVTTVHADEHHVSPDKANVPADYLVTDKNPEDSYDVIKAVEYAQKYALQANSNYPAFEQNCTNFVSQCLVAGGISMDGDEDIPAKKRLHISRNNKDWFSKSEKGDDGLLHYATSSNFVNTDDFLTYFTETRGYSLSVFENDYNGKLACYNTIASGDVIILYALDGTVAHLGLITGIGDMNAYYCGNTTGRLNYCVFNANPAVYPRLGIIHMSK